MRKCSCNKNKGFVKEQILNGITFRREKKKKKKEDIFVFHVATATKQRRLYFCWYSWHT